MQNESIGKVTALRGPENLLLRVQHSSHKAQELLLSQQFKEGFWWYTLEANESICAEYILMLHLLGLAKEQAKVQTGLAQRILRKQCSNGSWTLYQEGPGDLSTTIECYLALKLAGHNPDEPALVKAREFILKHGGITQSRVFTKIHLALFGIVPWDACPVMPVSFVLFPDWLPLNIYEFSSWARACIVPLLVILEKRPLFKVPQAKLEELFVEKPGKRDYSFKCAQGVFSLANAFVQINKILKVIIPIIPSNPITSKAIKKAENWIETHIAKTEDIYPALAYSLLALKLLGREMSDPSIQKCLKGLQLFQQYGRDELPAIPSSLYSKDKKIKAPDSQLISEENSHYIHQQCCISPVWDTPWAGMALLESGLGQDHPALLKAARWLMSKQILETKGDWAIKNKKAQPGGWSFEFDNDYFPDVDDTIEVLFLLFKTEIPRQEMMESFQRGLDWLLSMQSKNGGWAAFDVDNTAEWVNKIPFSDHGACLDPPTPDITGRILELLGTIGHSKDYPPCEKALHFILQNQEKNGSWEGRWGVNYIYGTWCVLQGLAQMGMPNNDARIRKAVKWLKSIQREDGGWSESCESYTQKRHIPLPYSTASQTAWALMGLIAVGEAESDEVQRGIEYLLGTQLSSGGWNEEAYTGTGFPGHFYIRYHGYRHYFPLLALAKFKKAYDSKSRAE